MNIQDTENTQEKIQGMHARYSKNTEYLVLKIQRIHKKQKAEYARQRKENILRINAEDTKNIENTRNRDARICREYREDIECRRYREYKRYIYIEYWIYIDHKQSIY